MRFLMAVAIGAATIASGAAFGQTKSLPKLRLPVLRLSVQAAALRAAGGPARAKASPGGLRALAAPERAIDPLAVGVEEPDPDDPDAQPPPMNRGVWGFVTPWVDEEPEEILEERVPVRVSAREALPSRRLGTMSLSVRQLPILRYGVVRAAPDKTPDLGLTVLPYAGAGRNDLDDLGMTVVQLTGTARPKTGERAAAVPRGIFNLGFGAFNPSLLGLDFGMPNVSTLGAAYDVNQYLHNPAATVLPSVFGRIR